MYYSSPLHKGTLINYEDMRILKYRGETKSGLLVLICGRNRAPHSPSPSSPTLALQINILQINLKRFAATWQDEGRKEGRKVGRLEVEERTEPLRSGIQVKYSVCCWSPPHSHVTGSTGARMCTCCQHVNTDTKQNIP